MPIEDGRSIMSRTPLPSDYAHMWKKHNKRQGLSFWDRVTRDQDFVWRITLVIYVCFALALAITPTNVFERENTLYPTKYSTMQDRER